MTQVLSLEPVCNFSLYPNGFLLPHVGYGQIKGAPQPPRVAWCLFVAFRKGDER